MSTWIFQLLYGNLLRSTSASIFNCSSIKLIAVLSGSGNDGQGAVIYWKGISWRHKPAKLLVMTVRRAPLPQSDFCSIFAPVTACSAPCAHVHESGHLCLWVGWVRNVKRVYSYMQRRAAWLYSYMQCFTCHLFPVFSLLVWWFND